MNHPSVAKGSSKRWNTQQGIGGDSFFFLTFFVVSGCISVHLYTGGVFSNREMEVPLLCIML